MATVSWSSTTRSSFFLSSFFSFFFQGWSRGIWTTTVFLWSTAPRASLESLDQVGLEGFLFQDCLFQGWSRGIWTTTVYLWSTAPRTSLGSLDHVGLLVRFTFHRVGNITLKVLHISGKMFDDLSVTFVEEFSKLNTLLWFMRVVRNETS